MFEITCSENISEHERLRRNLEEDIDNWLAEGNEIEEVEHWVSGEVVCLSPSERDKLGLDRETSYCW